MAERERCVRERRGERERGREEVCVCVHTRECVCITRHHMMTSWFRFIYCMLPIILQQNIVLACHVEA